MLRNLVGQISHADDAVIAQRQRRPDRVAQFADVAGPSIVEQSLQRRHFNGGVPAPAGLAGDALAYQNFLVPAVRERRQIQRDSVQTVIQVFAKLSGIDQCAQITMGRADYAQIDIELRLPAQRRHLALLEHAQEARLQEERHVADLVQEQSTSR
jgi:hypothetical protein